MRDAKDSFNSAFGHVLWELRSGVGFLSLGEVCGVRQATPLICCEFVGDCLAMPHIPL